MRPAARYAAAIAVLDAIQSGEAAEKALTNWGRKNRYAGSKDRAAIRDHVFDVLRKKRSCAYFGGGLTGRRLVLGHIRQHNIDPDDVFTGEAYAPAKLDSQEAKLPTHPITQSEALDLPDWVVTRWQMSLGADFERAALAQRERAPISLRVNARRSNVADAIELLAEEGIEARAHNKSTHGIHIKTNHRRVSQSKAFQTGIVEFQDASSQIAIEKLHLNSGCRVLDFCAGGGGKALAIADRYDVKVVASDIDTERMSDIPIRSKRAGVKVSVSDPGKLQNQKPFDLVFCDAPCSGSGTWRRTPDAKWRLTESKFLEYPIVQREVLQSASRHVARNGQLAYATCSVLSDENSDVVSQFLAENSEYSSVMEVLLKPEYQADGFYLNVLQRD